MLHFAVDVFSHKQSKSSTQGLILSPFLGFCLSLHWCHLWDMISFSHVLFICPLVSHMVMQHNIKVRTLAITEEDMNEGALFGCLWRAPVSSDVPIFCTSLLRHLQHFFFITFTFDFLTSEDSSVGASERVEFSQRTVVWSAEGVFKRLKHMKNHSTHWSNFKTTWCMRLNSA